MRILLMIQTGLIFLILFPKAVFPSIEKIKLPEGFKIEEFASGLGSPRFMAFSPDGVLFSTILRAGKVVALPDSDKNGKAEKTINFISGLHKPHGIAFHDGYIYVGETNQIVRFKYNGVNSEPGKKEVLVPNLPTSHHFTKTVSFGTDGKMYVSVGSSCNVCEEKDHRRATILQFNSDGTNERIYSTGLRNSVGIAWHPGTGEMWASDNGRDWLGDNLPPDEINIIKEGNNYGWPFCYGDRIPDPKYNNLKLCTDTTAPVSELQAHSAPLGLDFYTGDQFPEEYIGNLFVAYHGSWNRSTPTGYKVVRIKMPKGKPQGIEDFATGWLQGTTAWGRPADVISAQDGSIYVSDDRSGVIYRITYQD